MTNLIPTISTTNVHGGLKIKCVLYFTAKEISIEVGNPLCNSNQNKNTLDYKPHILNQGQGCNQVVKCQMKRRLGVPGNRPVADFLPTISIKAKDFAAEMTNMNVQTKDLYGEPSISQEHVENNLAVRKILLEKAKKTSLFLVETKKGCNFATSFGGIAQLVRASDS